jgi:hypothetical protein
MLKDFYTQLSTGKKYLFSAIMLINIALFVILIVNLASYYFISKELDTLTSRCYESGGTVKMEVQNLPLGKYEFQCIKN